MLTCPIPRRRRRTRSGAGSKAWDNGPELLRARRASSAARVVTDVQDFHSLPADRQLHMGLSHERFGRHEQRVRRRRNEQVGCLRSCGSGEIEVAGEHGGHLSRTTHPGRVYGCQFVAHLPLRPIGPRRHPCGFASSPIISSSPENLATSAANTGAWFESVERLSTRCNRAAAAASPSLGSSGVRRMSCPARLTPTLGSRATLSFGCRYSGKPPKVDRTGPVHRSPAVNRTSKSAGFLSRRPGASVRDRTANCPLMCHFLTRRSQQGVSSQ